MQGEPNATFYLIKSGRVAIVVGDSSANVPAQKPADMVATGEAAGNGREQGQGGFSTPSRGRVGSKAEGDQTPGTASSLASTGRRYGQNLRTGERIVASLGSGRFFGERALLRNEPANATVRVVEDTTCYCCDRATFQQHFGRLQDLIDDEAARRDADLHRPRPPAWDALQVKATLGRGGFGLVQQVADTTAGGRSYALKRYSKEEIVIQKQETAVLNEKRVLSSVRSDFIVRLEQTYQSPTEVLMLLELVRGGALSTSNRRTAGTHEPLASSDP